MYLGSQVKKGFLQQNIKDVNHRRQDSTTLKLRNSKKKKEILVIKRHYYIKREKINYKLRAYICNMCRQKMSIQNT